MTKVIWGDKSYLRWQNLPDVTKVTWCLMCWSYYYVTHSSWFQNFKINLNWFLILIDCIHTLPFASMHYCLQLHLSQFHLLFNRIHLHQNYWLLGRWIIADDDDGIIPVVCIIRPIEYVWFRNPFRLMCRLKHNGFEVVML